MSNPSSTSNIVAASDQAQSPRRWWLWLLMGALGLAAVWLIWGLIRPEEEAPPAPPPTAVETETTQLDAVNIASEFVGALEAQDRVVLRPEVEGRITAILVEDGDRVAAGTPILQLSPDRPRAVVTGAIADIEAARASRTTAQAELLEAEAARDSAIAEETLQGIEYDRTVGLVEEGALAQQSLDQITRSRDATAAERRVAERRIEAARANLSESTASLRRAEASADVATEDLSDYEVVAPIDGVVGDLPVKIGDFVGTGAELTTLTRNDTMDLRLPIPVNRADELREGLPVELRTEEGTEPLVVGRISFVAERVENGAQSILAKATFPNPDGRLRDEQFVRARVIWDEESDVLVPTTAISRIGGQTFVFVVQPSETETGEDGYVAVQRPVTLGVIEDNRYQVIEGLEAGETIVTAGLLRLSDGAAVTPE
ncbi:MAG: efflux RND transporter periplasmic adaptor subunit [Cyanobacteria bacterium P01_A01_bin.135]